MPSFEVGEGGFLLNGRPFRIVAGAMHYFRVHPDQWVDRIEKARRLGLNAIDTYVAWNFHSSSRGQFDNEGWRDLGRYLDLIADAGMYAIVRPGPYICAEWTNGGLPTWLTADPGIRLRSDDPAYLSAVDEYYSQALAIVTGRQITRGGNVLMVQVENEYGAFGSNPNYLRELVRLVRAQGIDVPLFTCDQANGLMLERGGLPELLRTATFGSRASERLDVLREFQSTGPLMCAEFWNGWFDSWGRHHHVTAHEQATQDLDEMLSRGASVNLYMFHGGTNFGLSNGANDKGVYVPITTSYDYDAPLAEHGAPTAKYWAIREVLQRHVTVPPELPEPARPSPEFRVGLSIVEGGEELPLGPVVEFDHLPCIEDIAQTASFVLYETDIEAGDDVVVFDEIRDRAFIWLDEHPVATLTRMQHDCAAVLPAGVAGRLRVLVEDLGRVNYGPRLGESKGLIGVARTARRELVRWRAAVVRHDAMWGLAPADLGDAASSDRPVAGPCVFAADFESPAGEDLLIDTANWGAGLVWFNGVLVGRYSHYGPTRTLYIPGPLVRADANRVVVWELSAMVRPEVTFVASPILGHTEE